MTSNVQTQLNGKAPNDHASSATTYGVGTSSNYGHLRIADNLSTSSFDSNAPVALSAYRGKVLSDMVAAKAAVITGITGVQNAVTSGFGDVATQLCGGFAGVNASINGAQNAIAQQLYGNTIADMERSFGVQTAITDCCCKTQSGLGDVKYAIATEGANTRAAGTANTQAILDKLCQLELDGIKAELASAQRENISLQNQLNMAALRESQTAQNAFIQQGLNNEVDALYNRLSNCPVPSTPVYGRTPIFTCGNGGCGCGMAA